MNFKTRFFLTITIAALLACAACQGVPSATQVITAANAAQLQVSVQVSELIPVSDLVWSSVGSTIVALYSSGAARLNTETLETKDTFSFDVAPMNYAASPDGKTLAFSDEGNNIYLVDVSQTQTACTANPAFIMGNMDFSPDGKTLLTTSMDEIQVVLWDTTCAAQTGTISGFETAAPVYSAKFGEDGKRIIWISRGSVQLSDIASQSMGPEFSHEDFVVSAALSPNGKLLATAAAGTINDEFMPVIYLWDAGSGSALGNLTNPDAFRDVLFSADSRLVIATSVNKLLIWDAITLQKVAEIGGDGNSYTSLAISPDGTAIATADEGGKITLWKVK
jgi:WD40 repeat protein